MNDNTKNVYAPTEVPVDDIRQQGEFELAGRGTRLGAAIIDSLPFLVIGVMAGVFGAASESFDESVMAGAGMMLWFFAGVVMLILFAVNCILLHKNGQTIGKKLLGIKIVRTNGDRIGLGRILLLRVLPMTPLGAIPLVGYLITLVDSLLIFRESRKCLHDDFADTVVIIA